MILLAAIIWFYVAAIRWAIRRAVQAVILADRLLHGRGRARVAL